MCVFWFLLLFNSLFLLPPALCSMICFLHLFNNGRPLLHALFVCFYHFLGRWDGCFVNAVLLRYTLRSFLILIAASFTYTVSCSRSKSYLQIFWIYVLIMLITYTILSCKMYYIKVILMVKNCMTDAPWNELWQYIINMLIKNTPKCKYLI